MHQFGSFLAKALCPAPGMASFYEGYSVATDPLFPKDNQKANNSGEVSNHLSAHCSS